MKENSKRKVEIKRLSKVIKSFTNALSPEQLLLATIDDLAKHILEAGYKK